MITLQALADTPWTDTLITSRAELLRQHLAQRSAAVDLALPLLLQQPLATGQLPTHAWAAAFDSHVTALIPRYIDPAGGAPEGHAWSESTLLAALAIDTRLSAARHGCFHGAWGRQQAQLLRALDTSLITTYSRGHGHVRSIGGAPSDSFTTVSQAFLSAPWYDDPGTLPPAHFAYEENGQFYLHRRRVPYLYALPPGTKSWSLYVRCTWPSGTYSPGDLYENSDYPGDVDTFALIADSGGPVTADSLELMIGDGGLSVGEPDIETYRGWRATSDHRLLIHHTFTP